MTMSTEQEREHFSRWIAAAVPFDKNVGMVEHSIKTDAAWQAWQARASLGGALPLGITALTATNPTGNEAPPSGELSKLVEEAGMVNLLNHGAASCVHSEGCHGVTQEHLERFAELVRAKEREQR